MYIRCRLGQRGFLIIGTLVSPLNTTTIGGGPYAEIFFERWLDLGVEFKNVKAFSIKYFCLAMLFDKKLSGCKNTWKYSVAIPQVGG